MENTELLHFIEKMSADSRFYQKVEVEKLKEAITKIPAKLQEKVSSDTPEGWWVPISFYNKENGNGRVYNKRLWENVIERQKESFIGCPMLCDHPEGDSDGNPKDICGVWLDCKLEDQGSGYNPIGLVYGLLVPSGHLGEDLKDHLRKGLKVGTSSSGFGRLMSDGKTVDPDTFQIERLADWVLTPSQGTFFSYDECNNSIEDKSIRESKEIESDSEEYYKENKHVSKISKLEEKKFRRDLEAYLAEADNIKDPQEKLEEFKEIREYFEEGICPDLREKVEERISFQENILKEAIRSNEDMKETFGVETVNELKEKVTKLSEDVELAEKESLDWKKISETLQEKLIATKKELEKAPTSAYVDFLKEKNSSLKNNLKEIKSKTIEVLKEQTEEAIDVISSLKEMSESLEAENIELKKRVASLEETSALKEKEYRERIEVIAKLASEKASKLEEALKKYNNVRNINKKYKEESVKEARNLELRENPVHLFAERLLKSYGKDFEPFYEAVASRKTLADAEQYFFSKVITKMTTASSLNEKMYRKEGVLDRMPSDWK